MANILVIEPDRILAKTISDYISSNGHIVNTVAGAQDAVSSVDNLLPDIIILEIVLTSHNGIEFLYELRSYPDWQTIPVVIYSRIDRHELGITTKLRSDLNIEEILYKPDTSMKKLLDIIEDILR